VTGDNLTVLQTFFVVMLVFVTKLTIAGETSETYFIDDLEITHASKSDNRCASGAQHFISISGKIGPDSTFAVASLLDKNLPCMSSDGRLIHPVWVSLESNGGALEDGYKLGTVFREREVVTIVFNDKMCASSCAVAFLGGTYRYLAERGTLLFHAPYVTQTSGSTLDKITCTASTLELNKLSLYYVTMTDINAGERLFDRTMSQCSAGGGWTIKGMAAGKLYGVATPEVLPSITSIRLGKAQPNIKRLVLDLSQYNEYQHRSYILEEPSRLIVEIDNITINANIDLANIDIHPVSNVSSTVWNDNGIRLTFNLKTKATIEASFLLRDLNTTDQDGPRLVIDLKGSW
jgi:ATP-dependent protease ClpP protease subunit